MTFKLDNRLASDSRIVGNFQLCQCLLMNDSQYPWLTLVPMLDGKTEIFQLSIQQQQQMWLESNQLSECMMSLFKGDKLNIAAIGNIVSQLHIHHVVRFKSDASWPKPIWGQCPMKPYIDENANELIAVIQQKLIEHGAELTVLKQ